MSKHTMQDTLQVLFASTITVNNKSSFLRKPPNHPSENEEFSSKRTFLNFPSSSPSNSLSLPSPKTHQIHEIISRSVGHPPPADSALSDAQFQEKVLFLDSLGLDIFFLINNHRPMLSQSSLSTIQSTLDYLTSTLSLSSVELRRLISISPDILGLSPASVADVLNFLVTEAGVGPNHLKRVVHRRPRLLLSSLAGRLQPTLYFLQSIGITETFKHTYLLSCSVEEKLVPKIEYFEGLGFTYDEAIAMFRRFPQMFNYSVKGNIEPKINYIVMEMGRDLKEVRDYPLYFSFSLENRIKRRHRMCAEYGVCLSLKALLRPSEDEFRARLDVLCESSLPLTSSPFNCRSNFSNADIICYSSESAAV